MFFTLQQQPIFYLFDLLFFISEVRSNFVDVRIQTVDLWYWKQPLSQLSQNQCPFCSAFYPFCKCVWREPKSMKKRTGMVHLEEFQAFGILQWSKIMVDVMFAPSLSLSLSLSIYLYLSLSLFLISTTMELLLSKSFSNYYLAGYWFLFNCSWNIFDEKFWQH